MRKIILLVSAIFFVFTNCNTPASHQYLITKSLTVENAAVVSAFPLASEIGAEIMKKGGNAVDAAIAVQFALAVCFPYAGNIGGGGFMLYRDNDGLSYALDFREKAPLASKTDMYLDSLGNPISELSRYGHLSAGVPGSVAGMAAAYEKFSKLKDWKALVQPAIDLARSGFHITEKQVSYLNEYRSYFKKYNTVENEFSKVDVWETDYLLIQEDLATTLEAIRDHGRKGFYEGPVADKIVAEMERGGGIISHRDLKGYRAVWREPVYGNYKGLTVISMPPPSSGGIALLQLLEMVEPFDLHEKKFQSIEAIHIVCSASKRVYADRALHLGDMDFFPVPVEELLDTIYADERMSEYKPNEIVPSQDVEAGVFFESDETTHFSIVDPYGNAVSLTTTLNLQYGSKVIPGGTGFFLNCEMDDFSAKPGNQNYFGMLGAEANKIEPGKRMLSSMTPTIVEKNGKLKMVLGSPGGSKIITSVFQAIINVFDYGMTMTEAINAKRFHHQWIPDSIRIEEGAFDSKTISGLNAIGYEVYEDEPMGRIEAIFIRDDGKLEGAADIRRDDHVAGF